MFFFEKKNQKTFDTYGGHDDARAAYLTAAFAAGDAYRIADALAAIAHVKGLAVIAQKSGIDHDTLTKALASDAMPSLEIFVAVITALGLRLEVSAAESPAR